jgi:hypothetical protein
MTHIVKKIKIEEGSKEGWVWTNTTPPDKPHKIANNTDTGFLGIVHVLTAALVSGSAVDIEIGPGNELDAVTMPL